jgi:hypothetical protein
LVATLAINMVKAARKADAQGRIFDAAVKYAKASRYLEHSSGQYVSDREMREWTHRLICECREHAEGLGTSIAVAHQLAPSSRFLLHQHYGSRNEQAAMQGWLKPTAAK